MTQNIIRNSTITTIVAIVLMVCMVALPTVTYAATGDGGKRQACAAIDGCGGGVSDIQGVIRDIIEVMSAIGGVIAVIMIIIGGFKFMTAAGDSTKAASARNTIIFAVVGLVIIAFAQIIVRFVLQKTT